MCHDVSHSTPFHANSFIYERSLQWSLVWFGASSFCSNYHCWVFTRTSVGEKQSDFNLALVSGLALCSLVHCDVNSHGLLQAFASLPFFPWKCDTRPSANPSETGSQYMPLLPEAVSIIIFCPSEEKLTDDKC